MSKDWVQLKQRRVGAGAPCLVIAEAGVNHNGSLDMARRLVDVAAGAGADVIKFQTFKAASLVTAQAPKASYQLETTAADESQLDMIRALELSHPDFRLLHAYCEQRGILFMSTPFDHESADFLDTLGVAAFKVGSGDLTNTPFLAHLGRKGRPMIVSTGMARLGEVDAAVATIRATGNQDLVLLQCVSNYPAAPEDVNLRAMATMAAAFQVPVGYSDHTEGSAVALAAVALGACVIEKHFTLDRALPGPDHRMSLEPDELAAMVRAIRQVEAALGSGRKEPAASEADTARVARRSLVAERDIPAGTRLTEALVAVKRPGDGLPPAMYPYLIGRTAREAIPQGTLLSMEMFS